MKQGRDRARALIAATICIAGAIATPTHSQDAHYWTNQYGTRSELVGGLVVGSFLDLSSTYYNPGAIAFVQDPSLVLTADAWEYQSFDFDDIAPDGLDLRTGRFRQAPSMFAFQLPLAIGKHRFAVSVLTRSNFEAEASGTRIPSTEQLRDSLFPVPRSLQVELRNKLREGWAGLSWSYPFGSRLGFGVTTYLAGRGQSGRARAFYQEVAAASLGNDQVSRSITDFSYWNVRLLWKAGVAVNLDALTLGLTFTTPGLSLFGSGSVLSNDGITGFPTDDSTFVNELEANKQDGLAARFHSPPSLAFGIAYRFGSRTTAYATTELFDGVNHYTIVDSDEWVGQTTGDTLSNDLKYELKGVMNWGLGVEHRFSERFQGYLAYFTDRSALPEERDEGEILLQILFSRCLS